MILRVVILDKSKTELNNAIAGKAALTEETMNRVMKELMLITVRAGR